MITRCSGQLRLAQNATVVIGLDLSPALSLATALGYDMASVAELLPAGEAGLVTAVNERLASQHD
ncbi:MAG: hypothetical protein HWD60_01105 [Defluviicoccus sp.]|nr:MAG: hypothetical protein HWD60_01105 [Defluviicoccus sp.]